MKWIFLVAAIVILPTACSAFVNQQTAAPVVTDLPQASLPNPASAYCEQQANRLEIRTAADGSQSGVCIFPDGSECDEWAYFRGECGPTLQPVTPDFVEEPLAIHASDVPIPYAVLVNTGDQRGITAYDRSGLALGEWQTMPMTGKVHAAGPITDGIASTPLIFWNFDAEKPGLRLNFSLDGNITPLLELADSDAVHFTDMVGLPANPV